MADAIDIDPRKLSTAEVAGLPARVTDNGIVFAARLSTIFDLPQA